MVDTVVVRQIQDSRRSVTYEFTNESDGTGESAVRKIDITNLVGRYGVPGIDLPDSLALEDISYEINGFNYVTLYWDRQPSDIAIITMVDSGGVSYKEVGGRLDPNREQDGTGDIILTTDGGADGSGYRIIAKFRKKYV